MIAKLNEKQIRLNIIALDFANELADDDSDQEENRPSASPAQETAMQTKNKRLLMSITEKLDQAAIFPASVAMQIYQ